MENPLHNEVKKRAKPEHKGRGKIATVMHEFKKGILKSGSGHMVKGHEQAIAIALSEARKAGAHIAKK